MTWLEVVLTVLCGYFAEAALRNWLLADMARRLLKYHHSVDAINSDASPVPGPASPCPTCREGFGLMELERRWRP